MSSVSATGSSRPHLQSGGTLPGLVGSERWQRPAPEPAIGGAGSGAAESSPKFLQALWEERQHLPSREQNVLTLVLRAAARIHLAGRLAHPPPASSPRGPGPSPSKSGGRAGRSRGAHRVRGAGCRWRSREQVRPPRQPRTRPGRGFEKFRANLGSSVRARRAAGGAIFLGKRGCSRLRKSQCSDDDLDSFITRLALHF